MPNDISGGELCQKKRTADVLDCLLGKKDPSVLTSECKDKPVVSITDSEDDIDEIDVKPSKRVLHNVREHPAKKKKNPFTKFSEKSGSGKILDDSISDPSNSDGRRFLDQHQTMVPNSMHNPKMIVPKNYCPSNNFHRNKFLYNPINKNAIDARQEAPKGNKSSKTDKNGNETLSKEIIQKLKGEWMKLTMSPPKEIVLESDVLDEKNITHWKMILKGPRGTSYYGDKYNLQIKFGLKYPQEPPEVSFFGTTIPKHPQVDNKGRVAIPSLGKEWSSTFSVKTICLSVISMLASADEDEIDL